MGNYIKPIALVLVIWFYLLLSNLSIASLYKMNYEIGKMNIFYIIIVLI